MRRLVKAAALAASATGEYRAPSGAPGAGNAAREAAGDRGLKRWTC